MNKRKLTVLGSIFASLLLVITIVVTLLTPSKVEHKEKDKMLEASSLTMTCYEKIKEYKIAHNISLASQDKFESYMIGEWLSPLNTTEGEVDAKNTSVNPNFAALYINFFSTLGLKEGDNVVTMFSGSFPCLNISCLAACKVYGLHPYVMASIGASSYGANNVDFTGIDMIHYLSTLGLIDDVSLASYGGFEDNLYKFIDVEKEVVEPIRNRIEGYGIDFVYFYDFHENVLYRKNIILNEIPNVKAFINVGGTSLSLGLGKSKFETKYGLIKHTQYGIHNENSKNIGLIDVCLNQGIDVIHMLNIRSICAYYGLPYNPDVLPNIGEGDCYYEIKYDVIFPSISLVLVASLLALYYVDRKRLFSKKKEA